MNDTLARPGKCERGKSLLFTDDRKAVIMEELAKGSDFTVACQVAKVTVTTGYQWRQRGKRELEAYELLCDQWDGDPLRIPSLMEYGHFEQGVQWAMGAYWSNLRTRWTALAGKGDWAAEARLNEAQHRKFARQETLNVNQKTTHTEVKRIELVVVGGDNWKQGALHDGSLTLPALPPAESGLDVDIIDTAFAEVE